MGYNKKYRNNQPTLIKSENIIIWVRNTYHISILLTYYPRLEKKQISKLQRFYSKCIRVLFGGGYKENCNRENNQKIREENNNITTIESKLKYYRLNTYYGIRETQSIAYLNDKGYIDNELKTLDTYINLLANHILSNEENLNNIIRYKTLSTIGKHRSEKYRIWVYPPLRSFRN